MCIKFGSSKTSSRQDSYQKAMPIISDDWRAAFDAARGNLGTQGLNSLQQSGVQALGNMGLGASGFTPTQQTGIDQFLGAGRSLNSGGFTAGQQGGVDWLNWNNQYKPVETSAAIINNDLMGMRGELAGIGAQYDRFTNQEAPTATAMSGADFISRYTNDPTAQDLINTSREDYLTTADRARNVRALAKDASGAFGDRAAIADAVYDADTTRGLNSLTAGIRSSIYDRAIGAGQQDAGRFTDVNRFNADAERMNRDQQLKAIGSQEANIIDRGKISQNILDNVVTSQDFNLNNAKAMIDAGTIGLDQVTTIAQKLVDSGKVGVDQIKSFAEGLFNAGTIGQDQYNQLVQLAGSTLGQEDTGYATGSGKNSSFGVSFSPIKLGKSLFGGP